MDNNQEEKTPRTDAMVNSGPHFDKFNNLANLSRELEKENGILKIEISMLKLLIKLQEKQTPDKTIVAPDFENIKEGF